MLTTGRAAASHYYYGSTPPTNEEKMADSGSSSSVKSNGKRETQTPTGDEATPDVANSSYRRLESDSVHIPPERRKWRRILKNLIQLRFRQYSSHSNVVHTTKYTLITFLPKNLIEQFHRLANLYFLLIIILNFIPSIEAFGKEVSWIPLTVILLVTAIKDAFEDIRRYLSDKEINGRLCEVYSREKRGFVQRKWQDVRVGDILRLSCDEVIPADILLLESSDENSLCYMQTSNLDGETTLKQREVPPGILEKQESDVPFVPNQFTGELYCEQPNKIIYEFKGYVQKPTGDRIVLGRNHLLLRGCIIRNTNYVIGKVVYAGHETKAMLNNTGLRSKRSKLERDINFEIGFSFFILFVLCFIGAVLSGVWTQSRLNLNIVYFPFTSDSTSPALEGFVRFWTFVIIFQVIVPISLYISMEIVKISQVIFISWDNEMYYAKTDRPFQCRALNINEDLGQIQYVFTDKTGTLTENEMIFRCCAIAGVNYSRGLEVNLNSEGGGLTRSFSTALEGTDYPNPQTNLILDSQLQEDLSNPSSVDSPLHHFLITMAICNTVVVAAQRTSGGYSTTGETKQNDQSVQIIYEAESSDEYALVQAAKAYGYILLSRSPSLIRLQTPHQQEILEIELLHVLEFTSDRKRMSVIVRLNGQIILYSKGADSVIYSRLDSFQSIECRSETQAFLNQYAILGLRTLCLAKRVITEKEYQEWLQLLRQADTDLENREQLILEANSAIETKLQLLGTTGIEDRLQDGVPDAIQSLKDAGIIVWVLTGDKKETAINVGYSSHLMEQDVDIISIHAQSEEECYEKLRSSYQEFSQTAAVYMHDSQTSHISNTVNLLKNHLFIKLQPLVSSSSSSSNGCHQYSSPLAAGSNTSKALVIDGATLVLALKPSCSKLFLALAKECSTVICCRAAPLEKAAVVQLMKESGVMTLAIGDGANDVSMIQQANVGIGIAGKEGMQAALASDFNMARFRYIKRLLLVHGHWCYYRLANLILYFFYKNVMYAVLLFWYQLFNGLSGSNPIDGVNLQIFNLVYTSLPILVVGTADQDVSADTLLKNKSLYNQGRCSQVYTRLKFWLVILEAFYQSAVIFFIAYGVYYGNSTIGVVEFGFVINISAVLVANLHLAVETVYWTWIHHLIMWGSCVMVFVFNYVYCALNTQQRIMDTYFVMQELSTQPRFWLVLVVTPMIALLPRLIGKVIQQDVFPNPVLRARKEEQKAIRIVSSAERNSSSVLTDDTSTAAAPHTNV